MPTIDFPGRPRSLEVTSFDEVVRNLPDSTGSKGTLVGAHVRWLAPAVGAGSEISSYQLSSRPAMAPNATAKTSVVALSAYADDDSLGLGRASGSSEWTIASSRIPSEARKEAEGTASAPSTFYSWYVPRLECGEDYVFAVRGFNAFHGYGKSRKVLATAPSCSPTTEPSFPPTSVSEFAGMD